MIKLILIGTTGDLETLNLPIACGTCYTTLVKFQSLMSPVADIEYQRHVRLFAPIGISLILKTEFTKTAEVIVNYMSRLKRQFSGCMPIVVVIPGPGRLG